MSAADLAVDLATRLGLRKRPRSWGGDCPSCSYHGAFAVKVGKADRPLLFCANGCTAEQLNDVARNVLGSDWRRPAQVDKTTVAAARAAKQVVALRLWNGSESCAGTPSATYLGMRSLAHLVTSPALRHRTDTWHPEHGHYPALIALVQDAAGMPLAVHRTYLKANGTRAGVDPSKASLGPVWGGLVVLHPLSVEMVVGEGLETAASAGLILGLPALAALSAGNLAAGVVLPNAIRSVVIAADNDAVGQRAALDAASRWRSDGRTVRIATPDRPGKDFNDVLRERANG